jgi:hypothetical protein
MTKTFYPQIAVRRMSLYLRLKGKLYRGYACNHFVATI